MGWARYAQTIRIFVLNSGLFYIQPSERTVRWGLPRVLAGLQSVLHADCERELAVWRRS
jgi:hypothetical protein